MTVTPAGECDVSAFFQHAVDEVLKGGVVDPERVVVVGGSHGGFLTLHLIGQFPVSAHAQAQARRGGVCC